MSRPDQILYSYPQAATLLGLPSAQALRDIVYRGDGPARVQIGRRVSFMYADLVAWAETHRQAAVPETVQTPPVIAVRRRGRPTVAERQQARASR